MSTKHKIDLSKVKIGQEMKRADGAVVTLQSRRNPKLFDYPYLTSDGQSHLENGWAYSTKTCTNDIVAILPTQPKKAAKKSKPKLSRKLVEQTISNLKTILETL